MSIADRPLEDTEQRSVRAQPRTKASHAAGSNESLARRRFSAPTLLTAVVAEADVVRRISESHGCPAAAEKTLDILWLGRIPAQQAMLAEAPQVPEPCSRYAPRSLERAKSEDFRTLAFLFRLK